MVLPSVPSAAPALAATVSSASSGVGAADEQKAALLRSVEVTYPHAKALNSLIEMGFTDVERCVALLDAHRGDLLATVRVLLHQ